MAGASTFGAGSFFVCFGLNNKQIFQRGEKASGAANESQAVCVCLQVAFCPGRNSNLSSRDFWEKKKNNGGCWPSAKCQRRLWELLEIPIERTTFPRVQELVSQQPARRDQQGHATSCRQRGKLLNLGQHFHLQRPFWQNHTRRFFPTICRVYMMLFCVFLSALGHHGEFPNDAFIFRCAQNDSVGVACIVSVTLRLRICHHDLFIFNSNTDGCNV